MKGVVSVILRVVFLLALFGIPLAWSLCLYPAVFASVLPYCFVAPNILATLPIWDITIGILMLASVIMVIASFLAGKSVIEELQKEEDGEKLKKSAD